MGRFAETPAAVATESKRAQRLRPTPCARCGRNRGLDCRACLDRARLDRARKRVPESR